MCSSAPLPTLPLARVSLSEMAKKAARIQGAKSCDSQTLATVYVWSVDFLASFHDANGVDVQFGFSDLQRTNLELDSYKEKIKENQEKIKLNKQLPYLVGNIVEILEMKRR
ncbi:hypothetical protein LWI29_004589 [Acer saccharum]|uniref:Uncharacterized protein n=1 Tax=Acer saccharum TaxID=4024 RepID=A0AA39SII3_ACESA|nr:hypothetical protein LWI29_004589 [Acer saccharum]